MIVPILIDDPAGSFLQLVGQGDPSDFKVRVKSIPDAVRVFLPEFPEIGPAGSLTLGSVGYIEDITEAGTVSAGIDERNAMGSTPNIAAHFLIPDVIFRTCGGIRALGINHELFVIGVFVEPSGCPQEVRPSLIGTGDLLGGVFGHLAVQL